MHNANGMLLIIRPSAVPNNHEVNHNKIIRWHYLGIPRLLVNSATLVRQLQLSGLLQCLPGKWSPCMFMTLGHTKQMRYRVAWQSPCAEKLGYPSRKARWSRSLSAETCYRRPTEKTLVR